MAIVITTESCSDLPLAVRQQKKIPIVPMHIVFPDRDCADGSIPVEEIYAYYDRTKKIPGTSAVNPTEFADFFHRVARKTGAEILHIGYSSQCSATFSCAQMALESCKDITVRLVDSRNVSVGVGSLMLYAADLLDNTQR